MPRRMSFSKTVGQMYDRTKDVTRRVGWKDVRVGDRITAIEKGMGLKKGEQQKIIGEIEVVSVRVELLGEITKEDCKREGFPDLPPEGFVQMLGHPPDTIVRRIEFKHVESGQ